MAKKAIKIDRKVTLVPAADLYPYINNSRTHSETQVQQIAASIREFGFNNPVLIDEDNQIIAGHGRLLAAKVLELEKVPAIVIEGLTENQKKAYVIADNKIALNAGWDYDLLKLELGDLNDAGFDNLLTGFDEEELSGLLLGDDLDDGYDPDAGTHEDEVKEADTHLMLGPYRFPVPREQFLDWQERIREKVGFEDDDIIEWMVKRLEL